MAFGRPRRWRGSSAEGLVIWVGKLQYELIEPISAPSDLYSAAVDPNKLLNFHHIAMRVAGDWDEFRAGLDREGRKIAVEGSTPTGLRFC